MTHLVKTISVAFPSFFNVLYLLTSLQFFGGLIKRLQGFLSVLQIGINWPHNLQCISLGEENTYKQRVAEVNKASENATRIC